MNLPVFERLSQANTVLLAGAGGGYDLFAGLPLLHWLLRAGKRVHLANLTFSDLRYEDAQRPMPWLACITPESHGSAGYCPELHLSRWLSDQIGPMPIHLIERTGAAPAIRAYRWLADQFQPDAVVFEQIKATETYAELTLNIESAHATQPNIRTWREIPC